MQSDWSRLKISYWETGYLLDPRPAKCNFNTNDENCCDEPWGSWGHEGSSHVKSCQVSVAGCAFGTFVAPVLADRIGGLAKLGQTLRSSSEFLWWDVAHLWRASWWKGSWMAPESCPEKDVHGGSTPCDILWQDHYLELKTQMGMGTGSSNLFCVSGVSGLDCLTWSCQLLVVAPQGRKPTLTFSLTAAALLSYASATARSLHMCLIQGLEKSEDSHCRRIFLVGSSQIATRVFDTQPNSADDRSTYKVNNVRMTSNSHRTSSSRSIANGFLVYVKGAKRGSLEVAKQFKINTFPTVEHKVNIKVVRPKKVDAGVGDVLSMSGPFFLRCFLKFCHGLVEVSSRLVDIWWYSSHFEPCNLEDTPFTIQTIPDPPFARLLVLRTVSSAIWAIAWNTVSPWYIESFGT